MHNSKQFCIFAAKFNLTMASIFSLLITRIASVFSKRTKAKKYSHLEHRLKALSIKKDSLSLKPMSSICVPSSENFTIFDEPYSFTAINTFKPKSLKQLSISMASIWVQREEEEYQRIVKLEKSIATQLGEITSYIRNGNVSTAESLLKHVAGSIKTITDSSIKNKYEECIESLSILKEQLRQEKIQRREEFEKKRIEEERNKQELAEKRCREEEAKRLKLEKKARELEERIVREEREHQQEMQWLANLATAKNDDADEILQYLHNNGVSCFYHFTDSRNVEMIKKYGGLYSWDYSEKHNIPVKDYGGDAQSRGLDARHDLQDYVRLSFCNDHPMAYRKHQEGHRLVLLMIKIDVAAFRDTLFSNTNAAANDHYHGLGLSALKKVNIRATQQNFVGRENPIFHEHQAECMIKTFIPKEYIINLENPPIMHFN